MTYTVCISTLLCLLYSSGHVSIVIASVILYTVPCTCVFHYPQDGDTPLYRASSNGNTDVVRVLLENKADPNISYKVSYSILPFQWTPLHITDCKLVVVYEMYTCT